MDYQRVNQTKNEYFPLMLNLSNRLCVIVGGGKVATRKILSLIEFGARVKVISPEVDKKIEELARQEMIIWFNRIYQTGDLEGARLAFACTDDIEVNEQVALEGKKLNVLTNIATSGNQSDFILPASVRRGDLVVSVSTQGRCPALARKLRMELEEHFIGEWEAYLKALEFVRRKLAEKIEDSGTRGAILRQITSDQELLKKFSKASKENAIQYLDEIIDNGGRHRDEL